jgi:hypothetical protein
MLKAGIDPGQGLPDRCRIICNRRHNTIPPALQLQSLSATSVDIRGPSQVPAHNPALGAIGNLRRAQLSLIVISSA